MHSESCAKVYVTRLVKSTGLVVISLHPTGFAMPRASSKPFIPIPFNAVC